MEREFDTYLATWKNRTARKPLIIRGARQTGKTYAVRKLGESFRHYLEINFERMPEYKDLFLQNLDPKRICRDLAALTGREIVPGTTLLFFDEVQNCPAAITALRYFFEELPQLHVISAGSLLEFALGTVSIPVGRVEYAYLRPLSFREFLAVSGNSILAETIALAQVGAAVHEKALQLVREYFFVGGMPRVVDLYLSSGSYLKAREEQREIIQTYRDDFLKYARHAQIGDIQTVFSAIPRMVGSKTVYREIDPEAHAYQVRNAIDLLEKAQVVTRVCSAKVVGIPLASGASTRNYKTIFLDVGLMGNLCGVSAEAFLETRELLDVFRGIVAEQFVGQELLQLVSTNENGSLFYWHRAKAGAQAELDYLVQIDAELIPVEVKSGTTGKLRSLHQFLTQYPAISRGVKISQAPHRIDRNIVSIPLYAVNHLLSLYQSQ